MSCKSYKIMKCFAKLKAINIYLKNLQLSQVNQVYQGLSFQGCTVYLNTTVIERFNIPDKLNKHKNIIGLPNCSVPSIGKVVYLFLTQ